MNAHKKSLTETTNVSWLLALLAIPVSPVAFGQSVDTSPLTQEMFSRVVTVDGHVISWPAGGWYQVQNTQDFNEVCNGFISSCDVEFPGIYQVINHSQGLRLSVDVAPDTGPGGSINTAGSGVPYADGDTIRWDSPYWYQVQSRATDAIVCQGGSECVVENGDYWVTQHRVDGGSGGWLVVVDAGVDGDNPPLTQATFVAAITVDGLVISWPEGGWYQVQNTQDFSEVCNGNISSCQVESPGTYQVLNHSQGLRLNVEVGQNTGTGTGTGELRLNGLVLSWPDNGWYQVQQADTFATVCEGGTSCEVYAGSDFIVINHTTGQRETVSVAADNLQQLGLPDVNEETVIPLMRQVFEIYNGRAYDARLFESAPLDSSSSGISVIDRLTPSAESSSSLLSNTNYSCSNGGTVNERVEIPGLGLNQRRYKLTYSSCQINDDLIDGYVEHYDSSFGDRTYDFEDYSVEFSSGGLMTLDGFYSQTDSNLSPFGDVIERNTVVTRDLDYFIEYAERRLQVNTTASRFDYFVYGHISTLTNARISRSISEEWNQSFRMKLPGDDSEYIVTLESSMDNRPGNGFPILHEFQFFNEGQISVVSVKDGSAMLFDANGEGYGVNILLDYSGSQTTYSWQNWADIFQTCCSSVR